MQAILAQPNPGQRDGIRHLAILEVMYDTGCRVQEVADVDRASREARLRLIEALMLLEVTADKLIDVVKEEPDERL